MLAQKLNVDVPYMYAFLFFLSKYFSIYTLKSTTLVTLMLKSLQMELQTHPCRRKRSKGAVFIFSVFSFIRDKIDNNVVIKL